MWTPAWQVTGHQPASTLVRGSTYWTWYPLARQSRRLQTHGNNWNDTQLYIISICPSSTTPKICSTAPPWGLSYNLWKWRNVPSIPYVWLLFLVFSFSVVYFKVCCLVTADHFDLIGAKKKQILEGLLPGTSVLQTGSLSDHMIRVNVCMEYYDKNKYSVLGLWALFAMMWVKLTRFTDTWMVLVKHTQEFNKIHIYFIWGKNKGNWDVHLSVLHPCS